jgi:hypothetical protein
MYKIKNWEKFNLYKPKNPRYQKKMTWIKLYTDLIDDIQYNSLTPDEQLLLVKLWLLAGRYEGKIPESSGVAYALRLPIKYVEPIIQKLLKNNWLEESYPNDSTMLEENYQNGSIDKIREDKIIKNNVWFDKFWECFPPSPRKVNKSGCLAKWKSKDLEDIGEKIVNHVMMAKSSEQWTKNKGEFIPMPMTYLNQERWEASASPTRKVWEGGI